MDPMRMSPRSQRLAGSLEAPLNALLLKYTSPDEVGFLTITAIEVSGDLEIADIFVKAINAPNTYLQTLQKLAKRLSHDLAQKISTRRTIKLRFKPDKSPNIV